MESWIIPFLHALILVPVTLLPIINPIGTAPIFVATFGGNRAIAQRLARQIAINSWFVMVASMLIGTHILALFGISLPVVRLGGGLLVAAAGWRMLHRTEDDDVHTAAAEEAATLNDTEIVRRSFFPMTFPLTTGPGTIAASIALGAQIPTTLILYLVGSLSLGLRCYVGVTGALFRLRERRHGAALARRDRYVGDDAADGFYLALRRHPDHVERLGGAPRIDCKVIEPQVRTGS
jgi:multiple antibiotic resistance protein